MMSKCLQCGAEVREYPSRPRKYCSNECYHKSRIGNPTWNNGLHGWRTPEHTAKLVEITIQRNKTQKLSHEQAVINGSKAHPRSGADHPQWKGGVKTRNQKLRTYPAYYRFRKSVFERDDYTCQLCLRRGGILNAHHIIQMSEDLQLSWDEDNGITLCKECHDLIHRIKREGVVDTCPTLKQLVFYDGGAEDLATTSKVPQLSGH